MNQLNNFLEHFKNLLTKNQRVKTVIQNSIKKHTNIFIEPKDIKISNNTIFVALHPIKKNEILFKVNEIISDINIQTKNKFTSIK